MGANCCQHRYHTQRGCETPLASQRAAVPPSHRDSVRAIRQVAIVSRYLLARATIDQTARIWNPVIWHPLTTNAVGEQTVPVSLAASVLAVRVPLKLLPRSAHIVQRVAKSVNPYS
jgi:hypothetical protein